MKFSIRDLLFLTAIVALGLAWWVDRSRLARAKNDAESDARYLSRIYNDPFVDTGPKEEALYRKYHTISGTKPPGLPPSSAVPRPAVEDPFADLPNSSAPTPSLPKK